MTPEEITRRLVGVDKDNNQIDYKSFNNYLGTKIKSRKVERRDERVKNIKLSKEASKTVPLKLRKKLMDRGGTPNLDANFYALKNI